ncbi:MAG: beta-lactamase family protein [Verrucomicrobia bacterium]|nr:beta-lactamase family protein [Verrucomicrobiota bacterium]
MTTRRLWMWILVSVAAVGGLVLVGIIGLIIWQYKDATRFQKQADTHNLRVRVEKMAATYLAKRPKGALVIGVVQKGETHWLGSGQVSAANSNAPDAATMFEIGSITKVFTGVALAQMVQEGRVRLEDTIEKHLPAEVTLPAELRPITLAQLATHTSGLPRLPANLDLSPANAANPYARYTSQDLYDYLRAAKLVRPPGRKSVYSNLGVGLLGHILELRAGVPFDQLVREQICQPLGMTETGMTLSEAQRVRLAPGHDAQGNVVSNWDFAVLAPAGGLRSCLNDLLKFVQANLATNDTQLGPALTLAQKPHFESWAGKLGLCWQIYEMAGVITFHWHNGGTGGYVSFLAFDRQHQTGVVLLSNHGDAMAGDDSLDRMGIELLKLAGRVSWE